MTLNRWMRQVHRWLSIAFTLGVAVYVAAMTLGKPPWWLGLAPLLPLISLLLTGLYLFVLPYVSRARSGRPAGAPERPDTARGGVS